MPLLLLAILLSAFPFFFAVLYSIGMLVYIPFKIWTVRQRSMSVWTCITRRRLLVTALGYLFTAPVPVVALGIVDIAGALVGNRNLIPDWALEVGEAFLFTWIAVALASLILFLVRPLASGGSYQRQFPEHTDRHRTKPQ